MLQMNGNLNELKNSKRIQKYKLMSIGYKQERVKSNRSASAPILKEDTDTAATSMAAHGPADGGGGLAVVGFQPDRHALEHDVVGYPVVATAPRWFLSSHGLGKGGVGEGSRGAGLWWPALGGRRGREVVARWRLLLGLKVHGRRIEIGIGIFFVERIGIGIGIMGC
jgi:hypothetical protein